MTFLRLLAALCAAFSPFAAAHAARQPAPETSLTVTAEEGFTVPVIVNGRGMRLRVDPGSSRIVLNPAAAARAGLNGSLFGARAQIGPIRVNGETSLTRIQIGDWRVSRRIIFFDRDVAPEADGIIGMSLLPHGTVTMRMRGAGEGERPIPIPVREDAQNGLVHHHLVGGETVKVAFRFFVPFSQATASAGAHLAVHNQGSWAGEPSERPILLGVVRPVRPMRFAAPISFGGLRMDALMVRTADWRGNYVLPTDPAAQASADPDEIVVTANVGRGRAQLTVLIGADTAGRCSSVTYVKAAATLTFTCPAAMSG